MSGLMVDLFAGGGGTSTGIEQALGRSPDIAVNHDPIAIAMHERNHPRALHFCESVRVLKPLDATGGRPVSLLWLSPDCTHFSKTKGGKPRDAEIRSLAEVGIDWAKDTRPTVIILENVEEFVGWGPLDVHNYPIKARAGEMFNEYVSKLRALGYAVEWRNLVACDYGAPTNRKRLFLIARCDGHPIVWPTPTHGPGRAPFRTAAEIIDWSLPCPSIFERPKQLAEKTLQRIAHGVHRYVLGTDRPYMVGDHAAATLVHSGNGERTGQTPRTYDLRKPLGTVVAGGVKHRLVAAFITKHFGGVVGHDMHRPVGAVTARDHHALTAALLSEGAHEAAVRELLARFPAEERYARPLFGAGVTITDIGSRMLRPRELFNAQGFPSSYVIDLEVNGKRLTAEQQTHLAGNSVPPVFAERLAAANVLERQERAA